MSKSMASQGMGPEVVVYVVKKGQGEEGRNTKGGGEVKAGREGVLADTNDGLTKDPCPRQGT